MADNNSHEHHSNPPSDQTDSSPANNAANTSAARKPSGPSSPSSTNAPPLPSQPPLNKQLSAGNLKRVQSPSPASSPRTSRNASPIRKDVRPQSLTNPISTQPSAAAIQRALSAANAPQLQQGTVADAVSKLSRQQAKPAGVAGEQAPNRPASPRVKSPPPSSASSSRRASATSVKKPDFTAAPPNISVQSSTPPIPSTPAPPKSNAEETTKNTQLQPAKQPLSRGPSGKSILETVQESADDIKEPSPAAVAATAELKPLTKLSDDEKRPLKRPDNGILNGEGKVESGSESPGTKSPRKKEESKQNSRPRNAPMKSYASLGSTKTRSGDAKQGMTVETETVPSVPQSALNVGDRSGAGRGENSGSVRQKPSSEAIRPKKERKKTSSKARSINQSTASSKADIFEQRVANAVDEANSSDSEETFVYESNPPEPQRRARHHSRTPSVTSSHSTADQQRGAIRNIGDIMDDSRRVAGKRSMKFSNNALNDPDSPDGKGGSVRSHTPRHFGRFGRGGSQQSMFDPDSPFTQASKLRSGQRSSRPNSPRSAQTGLLQQQKPSSLFSKKQDSSFDFDAEVGDDERTPLVGTVRGPRSPKFGATRRFQRSPSIDEYYGVRRRGRCGRYGGCILAVIVVVTVLIGTLGFLFMSNRPLYDVEILQITNVLASEQELMLDLWVAAVNPNALGITVTEMDMNVFARSKHVGSGSFISDQQSPPALPLEPHAFKGGVDHGTDPPDDDDLERDGQTMLLGQIFHLDQALTFDASPFKRVAQNSSGELRLERPGNKTESGGSERWERVLQHPFQLTVRGLLKYQLPISSRLQTVAVRSSILVTPDDQDGS